MFLQQGDMNRDDGSNSALASTTTDDSPKFSHKMLWRLTGSSSGSEGLTLKLRFGRRCRGHR
jgi:hypothetical protein